MKSMKIQILNSRSKLKILGVNITKRRDESDEYINEKCINAKNVINRTRTLIK